MDSRNSAQPIEVVKVPFQRNVARTRKHSPPEVFSAIIFHSTVSGRFRGQTRVSFTIGVSAAHFCPRCRGTPSRESPAGASTGGSPRRPALSRQVADALGDYGRARCLEERLSVPQIEPHAARNEQGHDQSDATIGAE
jgi:hypothetical protein